VKKQKYIGARDCPGEEGKGNFWGVLRKAFRRREA
jgi:hypothetical protein